MKGRKKKQEFPDGDILKILPHEDGVETKRGFMFWDFVGGLLLFISTWIFSVLFFGSSLYGWGFIIALTLTGLFMVAGYNMKITGYGFLFTNRGTPKEVAPMIKYSLAERVHHYLFWLMVILVLYGSVILIDKLFQ